jgi:tRNA-specific 2-thiouridylase
MINYLTEDDSCPTRADMAVAKEVAEYLKIPFFTFDFIEEYEQKVLNYIFEGYKKGLTPNPDVFCNTWIKFDLFREEALSYGFDAVATGHYARISEQVQSTKYKVQSDKNSLLRGVDPDKDQSYFLAALSRKQLEQAMFPIGHLLKSEVRDIARKA